MSSIFNNLLHWAQTSGVLSQVQKAALAEVQTLITQAVDKASEHAPAMQQQIEQAAGQMVTAAIAGIATQAQKQ